MDYKNLIDKYIRDQERIRKRPLNTIDKFYVRDFARFIQNQTGNINVDITKPSYIEEAQEETEKQRVALITEDVGHLTGGRYYTWFIGCALSELGYEVTVYTNRKPVFGDYFSKYKQPTVKIAAKQAKELERIDVKADIYLGSPISGNIAAVRLAKKYNKPSYCLIFDPFPMMNKFLGKAQYVGWIPLLSEVRSSNTNIISLCNTTSEYIYDWLNRRRDQVYPIYPCINSRELEPTRQKREDFVVFISRLVKHKNFDHVLRACKKLGIRLKVISSIDGVGAFRMVREMKMESKVDFHMKVSDKEKFEIIKRARAVVNATKFEGFGMWFIEAITCGTPTVCYDYPTIREIRDKYKVKNVYLADFNDENSLQKELKRAYDDQNYTTPSKQFYFEKMIERTQVVFAQEPKIGIITIALNEDKFIGASLKSVIRHKNVQKVAVVEGAVHLHAHSATKEGLSTDSTSMVVKEALFGKNGNKIIYEQYGWANDKSELRNRALQLLGKDITHVIVVDADEVYKQEDLDRLVKAFKENPKKGVFLYPFYHFWKNKDTIAIGGQWDAQMFRCFAYFDKSVRWKRHELPVVNHRGKFLNVTNGAVELPDVHVYHYGYMKDGQNVRDKLEYYKKRDGHVLNVQDTWTNWKQGDPTQPTHGGGTVKKFTGTHPEEVKGVI